MKSQRWWRRSLARISLLALGGCIAIVFTGLIRRAAVEDDGSKYAVLPVPLYPETRLSKISCKWDAKTCLVGNLYYINGEFHAYVGSEFNSTGWDDFRVHAGIGWGSAVFHFVPDETAAANETVRSNAVDGVDNRTRIAIDDETAKELHLKSQLIPVFLHLTQAPLLSELPRDLQYRMEPTVFFSVLWPNLFRTLYAGMAAFETLLSYKLLFAGHYSMILMDKDPKPEAFFDLLQAVTPTPILWRDELTNTLFKGAALGLTRDALIAEIDLERGEEWRFHERREAFSLFCNSLKQKLLHRTAQGKPRLAPQARGSQQLIRRVFAKNPRVTLVLRDGNLRKILNEDDVIRMLKALPIHLSIHRFGHVSFTDQVRIVDGTDILISMRGAALTHILFMRPNSLVIELFPLEFHKFVYQNLAKILGINYMYWQNNRPSQTKYNWGYVNDHRLTEMPEERVRRLPIDWYNMDSKNFWRNQDTMVNIAELSHVVNSSLAIVGGTKPPQRYLMFLPWEQLNNQLIGFKSACAVATFLNRTLVLPHLGHRSTGDYEKGSLFSVRNYTWATMERYFDLEHLQRLPCEIITMGNFIALNAGKSVGNLRYHHLGPETSDRQLTDYFKLVVKLPFDRVVYDNAYLALSKRQILKLHGGDESRILALGSMFWYYNFASALQLPPTNFQSHLGNPLYRQIESGLVISEKVRDAARAALAGLHLHECDVVAIHVRRGDYWHKCNTLVSPANFTHEDSLKMKARCLTSTPYIQMQLADHFSLPSNKTLYIMTNNGTDLSEFKSLAGNWRRVMFQQDLLPFLPANLEFDPTDLSLLDQVVGSEASLFFGNLHSSFSRHVFEKRELSGKEFVVM